jgi:hypothetical protein
MYKCNKTYGVANNCNVKLNLNINNRLLKTMIYGAIVFLFFVLICFHFFDKPQQITFSYIQSVTYDSTYPLSSPLIDEQSKTYKIMAIADMDTNSKMDKNQIKYSSFLLSGQLKLNNDWKNSEIIFESKPIELSSQYSYGDRGMELSELVIFNGKLYSCDDRTGIIYQIDINKNLVIPWVILPDGDGKSTGKGFKCEWLTGSEIY